MSERRLPGRGTGGVFATTCVLVIAEFALLLFVYHLDDDVDRQYAAYQRASGTLSGVVAKPTREVVSATGGAVQGLTDAGIDAESARELHRSHRTWLTDPTDQGALDEVRGTTAAIGESIARRQVRVDVVAAVLYALLVVGAVALLFFVFRRTMRRHRQLTRALAERRALDSREQRLLALVENIADVIVILGPDSTVLFANSAAQEILQILPERLIGQRILDLVSSSDAATLARHLVTQRAGEHAVPVQLALGEDRHRVLEGTLRNLTADPAVNGWVLTIRDCAERSVEVHHSERAFHDSLTGLANRDLFLDRLEHAVTRLDRHPEPLSVIVCDLDDFKHVNDSRGHGTGDGLLVEVGNRLLSAIGPGDTAARLGGDEFAVLLEGQDALQAERVADRIQALFAEPFRIEDSAVAARASIGIAEVESADTTGAELLRNADVAMCWAKERGKSTTAVYDAGLHALALERLAIRGELQHAIREGQLVLHYQPTVDLMTETIIGFEALVRWQHPTRGLLSPQSFIPIAEQSGLIVELGTWVLREACQSAVSLRSLMHQPTMSVNVAAQQVVRPEFVQIVSEALEASGLAPHHLVLEITESVILDDMAGAVDRLGALRALGVHVAIDDFGTGYSSLAYLSRLPVDILKVDKSFVDDVCHGSQSASVTEAIIAMSQTMQLTTVAEGVELPEQAAWLQRASCTLGQGYLWSRPVELAGAHHLMRAGLPRQRSQHETARPRQAWPPAENAS